MLSSWVGAETTADVDSSLDGEWCGASGVVMAGAGSGIAMIIDAVASNGSLVIYVGSSSHSLIVDAPMDSAIGPAAAAEGCGFVFRKVTSIAVAMLK